MTRPKLENKNTRKIYKNASSYAITLPLELVKELGWREKQKLTLTKRGSGILIKDWEK